MNLYILKQTHAVDYDEVDTFVVRAEDATRARELAAGRCGDEGPDTWLFSRYATCEHLASGDGEPAVLARDFKAG